MLSAERLRQYLNHDDPEQKLTVVPLPDAKWRVSGASIDVRLGRWFRVFRRSSLSLLRLTERGDDEVRREERSMREYFIPFGAPFVVHPGSFCLGVTLEWISLPGCLCGMLGGKSSIGRRGLIIETASGIHPWFSGCLTLELANVGELPIEIRPGMRIAQVFFHEVEPVPRGEESALARRRKPVLGAFSRDEMFSRLASN